MLTLDECIQKLEARLDTLKSIRGQVVDQIGLRWRDETIL